MPAELNGIPLMSWGDAPTSPDGWMALTEEHPIPEPIFVAPAGYKKAAGVVLREKDGRIWLVAPSNAYGGYRATFPKGTLEEKSAQATAMAEAYEETGMHVRLLRHLVDVKRSQSFTRYYLAERIGGNPADMGWESQAVMLIPQQELKHWLHSDYDRMVVDHL